MIGSSVGDTFVLDGTFISPRMTDDVARLVLHADPQQALPSSRRQCRVTKRRAQQMNREVVEQASAESASPTGAASPRTGQSPRKAHSSTAPRPMRRTRSPVSGWVSVVSVDLSEGLHTGIAASNGAGVMAGGQIVYASPEHLYASRHRSGSTKAVPAPDAVVAPTQHGTDIHDDISDRRRREVRDVRPRRGRPRDQFAMDETTATCASPTTTGASWDTGAGESESQVVVLAPKGDTLTPIGHVGGLGRGETIQSVRFLGSVGYVVTFRQTDPLYTIDVSDPTNPHVAGESKILGFSAYLHPVGDGKLLGIGQTRPNQAGSSEPRSRSST